MTFTNVFSLAENLKPQKLWRTRSDRHSFWSCTYLLRDMIEMLCQIKHRIKG